MRVKALLLCFTLFLTSNIVAYADYSQCANCHLYGGEWNFTPGNLYYWEDSSVSSYGYGDSVGNAISGWNGVAYPSPTINSASSESSANLKYYIGEDVLDPGVGGETFFYINYDTI